MIVDGEKNDHKWGFKDSKFELKENGDVIFTGNRYQLSGYDIPDLMPFIKETFGVDLDLDHPKKEVTDKPVSDPNLPEAFINDLKKVLSDDQISFDSDERLVHSHGQTTADEVYQVLYESLNKVCDLVIYVKSEKDVQEVVKSGVKHNVCLVPYGGGTSVSAALKLPEKESRPIVVVDTRLLNQIEWIDEENNKASVQSGITGRDLESQLNDKGYTCGHEPDSIEFSTLGGWISTNASGMKKNRYGNIEEIVESVNIVTPGGDFFQFNSLPRVSVGIQPKQLLFGSEGNLGIITKAVINIFPLPKTVKYDSLLFKDWETGVRFLKELSDTQILPSSIRLVDNIQFRSAQALKPRPLPLQAFMKKFQKFYITKIKRFDLHRVVAATVVFEGGEDEVLFVNRHVKKLALDHGAIVGGSSNGKSGYMLTYAIAYIRDFLNMYEIIGETYETTVPWDKIHDVCDAVKKRSLELHKEYKLEGKPYVSPRITQTYNSGVCIYFTHGFCSRGLKNPGDAFIEIEHELRQTILDNGGSLSHHHGIGKIRKKFMPQVFSEDSIALLKDVKKIVDPQNTFGISNNVMSED